jgi:hypothetical protein
VFLSPSAAAPNQKIRTSSGEVVGSSDMLRVIADSIDARVAVESAAASVVALTCGSVCLCAASVPAAPAFYWMRLMRSFYFRCCTDTKPTRGPNSRTPATTPMRLKQFIRGAEQSTPSSAST